MSSLWSSAPVPATATAARPRATSSPPDVRLRTRAEPEPNPFYDGAESVSESVWERRRAACQDYAPKHREHGQLGLTQHFAATPISQEPKWARDSRIAKARDAQAPQAKRRAAAAPRSGAGAPLKQASDYRRSTKDSLRGCTQFSDLLI